MILKTVGEVDKRRSVTVTSSVEAKRLCGHASLDVLSKKSYENDVLLDCRVAPRVPFAEFAFSKGIPLINSRNMTLTLLK